METVAVQDYIKAIYQLGGAEQAVANSDVADRLGVRPPSVTAMLRRLEKLGLARHTPYQGVQLSERGVRGALEVIRHHRLLELYLTRVVGMSWDKVHDEAEVLEHVLSEELEARLDALLGFPTEDPHGDPIPTADLTVDGTTYRRLSSAEAGDRCVVRRVSDRDPELLRHLADVGLVPGACLVVDAVVPFGGGIRFTLDGKEQLTGRDAADAVFVGAEL